ncbi:MAG TPA: cold-shock protein [Pseudomonadales bacterium]
MWIRLVIAAVVAVVVSGFFSGYQNEVIYRLDLLTMAAFLLATVITVLLGDAGQRVASPSQPVAGRTAARAEKSRAPAKAASDSRREEGTVKWFNVSKGFGFITRDNGDDIFVHYRAIRGQGRRRLFDGQVVTFCIIDSDKGLQADDVEIIE